MYKNVQVFEKVHIFEIFKKQIWGKNSQKNGKSLRICRKVHGKWKGPRTWNFLLSFEKVHEKKKKYHKIEKKFTDLNRSIRNWKTLMDFEKRSRNWPNFIFVFAILNKVHLFRKMLTNFKKIHRFERNFMNLRKTQWIWIKIQRFWNIARIWK